MFWEAQGFENFHWSLYVTLFCIFSLDLERILASSELGNDP